jgi:hypothetical protein
MAAKDELVAKAKDGMQKFEEKFEELKDTAVKSEAEEAAKPKKEFADKTLDAGKSLLEDKDDFFSKAEKYAKGEYDAFSDKPAPDTAKSDEITKPSLDLPSE